MLRVALLSPFAFFLPLPRNAPLDWHRTDVNYDGWWWWLHFSKSTSPHLPPPSSVVTPTTPPNAPGRDKNWWDGNVHRDAVACQPITDWLAVSRTSFPTRSSRSWVPSSLPTEVCAGTWCELEMRRPEAPPQMTTDWGRSGPGYLATSSLASGVECVCTAKKRLESFRAPEGVKMWLTVVGWGFRCERWGLVQIGTICWGTRSRKTYGV